MASLLLPRFAALGAVVNYSCEKGSEQNSPTL